MRRPRATGDIIDKGDYLLLSFDPTSLTVPQLTGLLQYHEIQLPFPLTKTNLLEVFNREIKARSSELLLERNSGATAHLHGTPSRRVSRTVNTFGLGAEHGRWENNNVFQSGAMHTSNRVPGRNCNTSSSRVFPRNSLSVSQQTSSFSVANTRASLSELPQNSPVSIADSQAPPLFASVPPRNSGQWSSLLPMHANISRTEWNYYRGASSNENIQVPMATDSTTAPSTRLDDLSHPGEILRKRHRFPSPNVRQTLFIGTILALIGVLFQYKLESESVSIGYCDRGSQSNAKVVELKIERLEIEACRIQQAVCEGIVCPLSSGFFHPETCTSCPQHASCNLEDVICDDGYILSQHPLSLVPGLSRLCDGLPGVGSIAFPSKCIEDPVRKRSISTLEEEIDLMLAIERGRRICTDNENKEKLFEGKETQKWGIEFKRVKDKMKRKVLFSTADNFDTLFEEAVQQLLDYGYVSKVEDIEGGIFLATEHVDMTWNCRITVAIRNTWKKWRKYILGSLSLIISGVYGRVRIGAKRNEDKRVSELVLYALDALRNQDLSYHIDPIVTSAPYLSSLQLRDAMLQDEHSIAVRTRLWLRVEKVVEGNANVRANMEELPGGDELRVWRWIGSRSRSHQMPMEEINIGQLRRSVG